MFVWEKLRIFVYNYLESIPEEIIPFTEKLPYNVLCLIKEYSLPITRANWRQGSFCNNAFKFSSIMIKTHTNMIKTLKCINKECENNVSLADDIKLIGERLFLYYRYHLEYDNFYFYLCNKDNAFLNKTSILKKTDHIHYERKLIKLPNEDKWIIYKVNFNKNWIN